MSSTGSYIYGVICFAVAMIALVKFAHLTLLGMLLVSVPWVVAGCISFNTGNKLLKMGK